MLKDILSIQEVRKDLVIIKVDVKSPLECAENPGFSMNEAYITITRGKHRIMRFINKEGHTWSIEYGDGATTLVSDDLRNKRWNIEEWVEEQGILLEWDDGPISEATIYFNYNLRKWQLIIRGPRSGYTKEAYYFSNKAHSAEYMINEVNKLFFNNKEMNWVEMPRNEFRNYDMWKLAF